MSQRPSDPQPRTFEYKPAVRTAVPLLIGLNGPSSSGKTFSALRLATGIQRVVGGDIAGIDTEANRMRHYADLFKFHHVPFGPPFSPLDYLKILEFVVSKGARTIVIDSATHMHDGPGGILEMHADEMEAQRERKRNRRTGDEDEDEGGGSNSFSAWAKPKAMLRKFINEMTTGFSRPDLTLNLILCNRAKEKLKLDRRTKKVVELGLQPIISPELRYEMTTNILLRNGADGTPTWQTQLQSEQDVIKLPKAFRQLFAINAQLDEEMGQKMAEWSTGGAAPSAALDPEGLKLSQKWIGYWNKQGITTERVLATFGKPSVELLDRVDRARMDDFVKQVKDKQTTCEQLFASDAPPPDEEPADDKGDEPTAEELAAMEAQRNGNGASAGKGA